MKTSLSKDTLLVVLNVNFKKLLTDFSIHFNFSIEEFNKMAFDSIDEIKKE